MINWWIKPKDPLLEYSTDRGINIKKYYKFLQHMEKRLRNLVFQVNPVLP